MWYLYSTNKYLYSLLLVVSLSFGTVLAVERTLCFDNQCHCGSGVVLCYRNNLVTIPRDLPTDIERLWVQGTKLREFNLQKPLPNLRVLDLMGNEVEHFEIEVLAKFLPNLERLILSFNKLSSFTVSLNHSLKLEFLDLSYNNLEHIRIENGLECCKQLMLSGNRLKSVANSFQPMAALSWLVLDENLLTKIEKSVLTNLPSLQSLFVRMNRLKTIEFPPVHSQLKTIDARSNELDEMDTSKASLPSLESITLSENRFTTCHLGYGAPRIISINLSRNNISNCQPNSSLISRVKHLDLSENKIRTFTFFESSTLETLNLHDNSIYGFGQSAPNLLRLKKLNLRKNKISQFFITRGLDFVTDLILAENEINNMSNIYLHMPSLTSLDVSWNMIRELSPIQGYHKIKDLFIMFNKLELLDFRQDLNLNLLQILDARSNRIQQVYYSNLNVYFWTSILSDNMVSAIHGLHLSSLRVSILQRNNVSSLADIGQSSSLRRLDLSYNHISGNVTIEGLKNLQRLILANNFINTIVICGDMMRLTELDASSNRIVSFKMSCIECPMKVLFLDQNNLPNLALPKTSKVFYLSLKDNKIASLDSILCSNILQVLILERNLIKSLSSNSSYCMGLRELHLSWNMISSINILSGFASLWLLKLNYNQVADMNSSSLVLPGLRFLMLKGNRVSTFSFKTTYLPSLRELDLAENNLTEVKLQKELSNVRALLLDGNKITQIGGTTSYLPSLTILRAANNNVHTIFLQSFPKLLQLYLPINNISSLCKIDVANSSLLLFDISHNPVHCTCSSLHFDVKITEGSCQTPALHRGVSISDFYRTHANCSQAEEEICSLKQTKPKTGFVSAAISILVACAVIVALIIPLVKVGKVLCCSRSESVA